MKRTISSVVPGNTRAYKKAKKATARKASKADTLGRVSGKIMPSRTTLALAPGPFAGKKIMTFIYENELTQLSTAAAFTHAQVMSNSLYDFDKNGVFGNKQPLYFDTLVTAAGPYRQYKVISWKTTYTVYNASVAYPLTAFALPPHADTSDLNSAAEVDNWPGVKRLYLTPANGGQDIGTVTITGHVDDVYPSITNNNGLVGTSSADPGVPIYGGICISAQGGTPTVYIAIKHEAYCELQLVDAVVS